MYADELLDTIRPLLARADLSRREVVVDNLVFMYHVIVASEDILRECAVASRHTGYFINHLEEERNHAQWLKDDLESVGASVDNAILMHEAAVIAGAQYYFARHVSPAIVLGYMAVLECFPMALERVAALEALHGESLFRTLRYHAVHDIDHGADLIEELNQISTDRQPSVTNNALRTACHIRHVANLFGSFNTST